MLKLKGITKNYVVGDTETKALRGIDVEFRKSEFVAILGHSGCGKTTLLNIIGGLDQYTDGDLIIKNKSTKEFKDSDWDAYRNHSIGFVFQSYNLIPHQSILSNVELALTLSGVNKRERRKRAADALHKVGLGNELKKKPNQLSGGQMQRVAIARALVNDPEILLADEATGALDSATSIQIMDLLKEISKDRLVIMVTHNPDLAEQYATRTIKLLDGVITDDTMPYVSENEEYTAESRKKKKSMSLFTALSLSLNNLMTKKTRTLLTSFAGSIGIIGIALILSVSTGVQAYIDRVQEDTLSSYPINIQAVTVDMSGLIKSFMEAGEEAQNTTHDDNRVYSSSVLRNLMNSLNSLEAEKNDLKSFKKYIENSEEFKEYTSAVKYMYDFDMNVYVKDINGKIVRSDAMELISAMMDRFYGNSSMMTNMYASGNNTYDVWEEMLSGTDGELINPLLSEQYDVYGKWPESYDEAVLVVSENNELSDIVLYTLGLKSEEDLVADFNAAMDREKIDATEESWAYDELIGKEFKLILSADKYSLGSNGAYIDISETEEGLKYLYNSDKAINIKIVGIIKPNGDTVANMLTGSIAYPAALTQHIIELTENNELIKQQLNSTDTDIISGLKFPSDADEPSVAEKAASFRDYISSVDIETKADIYKSIASKPDENTVSQTCDGYLSQMTRDDITAMMIDAYSEQMGGIEDTSSIKEYINSLDDESLYQYVSEMMKENIRAQMAETAKEQLNKFSAEELSYMFDNTEYSEDQLSEFYDEFVPSNISDSTLEETLKLLGYIDKNSPSAINIYASDFASKDEISRIIDEYNDSVEEEYEISYTDYVGLIMSSVSTIINAISYVLIAFVAISLVVSSIMIGIITYISVLERTKEIGILRAIGASKKDISRVFNAETLIVGFVSGAMGVILTLLLIIPINIILYALTDIAILKAILPAESIVILVLISMFLTFIAGLIPSSIAAKKDPVIALRTE